MSTFWRFRSYLPDSRPEELRRALFEGSLYAPRPIDFNDPYDCLPTFVFSEVPVSEQLQRVERLIQRAGIRPPLDDVLRGQASAGYLNLPEHHERIRDQYLDQIRNTPILSFFPSADCPAMWAYYGDSGYGYVLGVDFASPLPDGKYPLPVEYVERRPCVDLVYDHFGSPEGRQALLSDCFLRKHEIWRQEAEQRLILSEYDYGYTPLGQRRISDLCLGWKASDGLIEEARKLASERRYPLRLMQAVRQENDYGLRLEPLDATN